MPRKPLGPFALMGILALSGFAAAEDLPDQNPTCGKGAGYEDVALAVGNGLCSTADVEERSRIHAILESVDAADSLAGVTVDYPLAKSIFPPDMEAPTFLWHDSEPDADRWLVDIALGDGTSRLRVLVPGLGYPLGEIDPQCVTVTNEIYRPTPYQGSSRSWKPSMAIWDTIKKGSVARPARITFLGYRAIDPTRVVSRGEVVLTTSKDPVGAPIFYRDVPLMPSATTEGKIKPLDKTAQPLIAWRLRDISLPESRVLLENMPTCANCHSFSADGATLAMDLDGPDGDKGAYAITDIRPETVINDDNVMTWNAFPDKLKGLNTLGFLSRIRPDGRYVVSTVNEAIYVRNFWNYQFSQVFYPTRGILAYHDRANGEIRALPGADDAEYVHCDPVWTPDGKTLVFARARAKSPIDRERPMATYAGDPNEVPIQYDLHRMPFSDGKGGVAVPIEGAAANGMSNSFPKVSPDGKWLVWVQAKNGQLMRPDGKLWILPMKGGEPRLMTANTPLMNSWHSFSPNSRWLVFSSKSRTPYTQMFLTHIDEHGNDSPAILIENSTAANRAVNIPEFVNVAYDRFRSITVPAVDHYEHFRLGNQMMRDGKPAEAIAMFEKALEGEGKEWRLNDWRIHDSLSKVLMTVGDNDRALVHIYESLRLNRANPEMHANLGCILLERGELERSLQHFGIALRINPEQPNVYYNRGTLRLTQGQMAMAVDDYSEAIRLDPDYGEAYSGRGITRRQTGEIDGALADFDRAIELLPDDPTSWFFRGLIRRERGDRSGAVEDLEQALALAPRGSTRFAEIEANLGQLTGQTGG